ncbi:MAG TPA: DUF4157 domain-containing protein [Nocardioidaceae bacterium]|nr:DUF4157 domain-containing protein [Nocardioidaceae bacterium]
MREVLASTVAGKDHGRHSWIPRSAGGSQASSAVRSVTSTEGAKLPEPVKGDMEYRLGASFADVRVHTDQEAAASARAVNARAYTTGHHIVFDTGHFSPATPAGRHTLAHELSHVVQQRHGPVDGTALAGGLSLSSPDDAFERAAEASAAVALSRPGPSTPSPAARTDARLQGFLGASPGAGRHPPHLQRQESAPPPGSQQPGIRPAGAFSLSADAVDDATAQAMVTDALRMLSAVGGTTRPFPAAVSGAASPPQTTVQTFLAPGALPVQRAGEVQRAGGGGWRPEGGFISALQLCYDFCNQEWSVVGWVWAGAGVGGSGLLGAHSFYGAFVYAEQTFWKGKLDWGPKLSCGTCATKKPGKDEESFEWGAGLAGFPVIVKPRQKVEVKSAGAEIGALLVPHPSTASATVEVIVLVDITQFLGPVGLAVKRAQDWINIWAPRLGVEVSCGVGVNISGLLHLCHSVPGGGIMGVTADSAKLCGGVHAGCDINLPHDKAQLPR